MTRVRQYYKGSAKKVIVRSNYPNKRVTIRVKRRVRIRRS